MANIDDTLDEVERVLSEYPALRSRGRIKVETWPFSATGTRIVLLNQRYIEKGLRGKLD